MFYTPNQVCLFKREKQSLLFSKFIPYFAYKRSKDFFLKISIKFFYILKKKYMKINIYAKIGIILATKMCFFRHMLVKIVKKNILVAVVLNKIVLKKERRKLSKFKDCNKRFSDGA